MAKCGRSCSVWSRVTGYFRPYIQEGGAPGWNPGKLSEVKDRVMYKVPHEKTGQKDLGMVERIAS
jgi:anaerobic ribonucleoside-triphosphate reductase